MQKVFNVLNAIEANSSRNTKKQILLENKTLENLRLFLLYAYSPRWIYGIGNKSIKKSRISIPDQTVAAQLKITQKSLFGSPTIKASKYDNIFDLCEELKKHPYGSNQDIKDVNDFLATCNETEFYWYSKLILKDLKIGCSSKTINEVYIDLIPEYDVMLAYPIENHASKLPKKGPFQLQRKFNGFRFITEQDPDGVLRHYTRNGVELFNFPQIDKQFVEIPTQSCTMVFDGEITTNDDKLGGVQSIAMSDGPKYGLTYHIWDCITKDEFDRKESFDTQFVRYDFLLAASGEVLNLSPLDTGVIDIVSELYRGDDLDQIDVWYDYAKNLGWEGIMVKFDTPYVRKRTDNMLKVKGFETEDLVVVRVNKGEPDGRHRAVMGSVTVLYKGKEVNVGGGFADWERKTYWESPNMIIDKTIEVRFFEETDNKSGTHSLQHPRFKGIRLDK